MEKVGEEEGELPNIEGEGEDHFRLNMKIKNNLY